MSEQTFEWRHANSDPGERVRVTGYSAEPFDVMLTATFFAMVRNRGVVAEPDSLVRAVLGALAQRTGEWSLAADRERRARPNFFPTFVIDSNDARAMEVIEATFRARLE